MIVFRTEPSPMMRAGLAVIAVAALTGCYGYFPADPSAVQPNEEVRLVLSEDAPRSMSTNALFEHSTLEGNFARLTDDSLAVQVWIGRSYRGTSFEQVHQTVTLSREDVLRVERRRLSKWRTALSAIGIIAAVGILADRTVFEGDPNTHGPNGPIEPPAGVLLRIHP